jgi:peptidoglycan DL-endopeptidase LytE
MKKVLIMAAMAAVIILPTTAAKAQYFVKQGDSMWRIAADHGMFYSDLLALNPQIKDPSKIYPKQFITVREGDKATQIIDYALALQPVTKYVYGAEHFESKPFKADCSSWTQHIYRQFGIVLPRVSWEQSRAGEPVPFEALEKGDLMFFGQNGKVSHVGIYMGLYKGQKSWISNLGTGQNVKIFTLKGSWTQKNFLYGGRVL